MDNSRGIVGIIYADIDGRSPFENQFTVILIRFFASPVVMPVTTTDMRTLWRVVALTLCFYAIRLFCSESAYCRTNTNANIPFPNFCIAVTDYTGCATFGGGFLFRIWFNIGVYGTDIQYGLKNLTKELVQFLNIVVTVV